MRTTIIPLTPLLAALAVLAACTAITNEPTGEPRAAAAQEMRRRPPTAVRARNLDRLVDDARADLATRLGLELEEVTLNKLVPKMWQDTQLGCGATPDEARQPPVPGYRLLFSTTFGSYVYHADSQRALPCPMIVGQ